ncbi:MAG: hypothetical protein JOY62_10195 [Acidobacteriaceae bacterium]|nr:hypothetical protein [Acidobacteriaceae bacterium]MBV9780329.1 hypothetical protein [Acidobacteriaceae bacterium]
MGDAISLAKYSIGVGDRFGRQAKPQLEACIKAANYGVDITPVWNKSNREHTIIGSNPIETRAAADEAVASLGWNKPYYVDADHINFKTVDRFIEPCDFFTIDVADWIGQPVDPTEVQNFLQQHTELAGRFRADCDVVVHIGLKYLAAIQEAARIYRYIEERKGAGKFITEVSMDETDSPQTPTELLVILASLADERVPVQTIAPKFTGRFNKGIDYEGDLEKFADEFSTDIEMIAIAVEEYGLPGNLKLSVHSGSDKFSLYEPMHGILKKHDAGVHLKTAGTNWLEELIGLAEDGEKGLQLVKEIYREAYREREELCGPYAAVIDIDAAQLPRPDLVDSWAADQFVSSLRHDPGSPVYNRSLRQLLHVAFKVAARMGTRYLDALSAAEDWIAKSVMKNLFERHIKPVFIGE